VSEVRILRRIFGLEGQEVPGRQKKVHNKKVHNLTLHHILLKGSN
jgi:hypothetical protein